ncbi:Ger(x)C family spore germination protein [Paenibacillus radicis (ex Gao et al. 2016)]|uniref:Spore germination protein KC n=1 Tax=Paenibacillus radicis (ex Gao et al. 2016) TaxID=1737354 RepID=A0A917HDA9_9BACL|nr:Ger(x)C family spore germination protein [Paenibacillus radicis (ex Gao et al. 2016)]GGG75250.1 spore germination protein KC [Paenibacillus radicis (ex Gao et al. 2016)]
MKIATLRRIALLLLSAVLIFLTTGCWSATEIQSNSYAKALGLDYTDGIYTVYVQMLEFSTVAKGEGGGGGKVPNIWLGHGSGKTLDMAINELYRTAQMHITWGHITSIVFSERLLESGNLHKVLDMISRYPESRYTTWVYGTRDSIEELLSTNTIFNESPLSSILHDPLPSYKDESLYPPVLALRFIAELNGKQNRAYLPNVVINKRDWTVNEREQSLHRIDGAFFEREGKFIYMSHKKLIGFPYLQQKMRRVQVLLEDEKGVIYGSVSVAFPNLKITPVVKGTDVTFRVKARYMAALYEYIEPMSYEDMVRLCEKEVQQYIKTTYEAGIQTGVDVFGLEEKLYRKYPKVWKEVSKNGTAMFLDEHSLAKIDVDVSIAYNGKYKRRV